MQPLKTKISKINKYSMGILIPAEFKIFGWKPEVKVEITGNDNQIIIKKVKNKEVNKNEG